MRIDDIEMFRVLAETLSYTNAANRLYLTQSSLTRIIQQMEEELGFQLFEKGGLLGGKSFTLRSIPVRNLYSAALAADTRHEFSVHQVPHDNLQVFFLVPLPVRNILQRNVMVCRLLGQVNHHAQCVSSPGGNHGFFLL